MIRCGVSCEPPVTPHAVARDVRERNSRILFEIILIQTKRLSKYQTTVDGVSREKSGNHTAKSADSLSSLYPCCRRHVRIKLACLSSHVRAVSLLPSPLCHFSLKEWTMTRWTDENSYHVTVHRNFVRALCIYYSSCLSIRSVEPSTSGSMRKSTPRLHFSSASVERTL